MLAIPLHLLHANIAESPKIACGNPLDCPLAQKAQQIQKVRAFYSSVIETAVESFQLQTVNYSSRFGL